MSGLRLDVVAHLTAREFRIRYRRSALGWAWSVIMPLARLAVLAFVFTRVIPLEVDNYVSFLYTGLLSWLWFSAGVSAATTSVVDRSDLLLRPGLHRTTVPLTASLSDAIDYLIALPLLCAWLLYEAGAAITAVAMLWLILAQFLLTLGVGMALAPLHVYVRDTSRVVDVLLLLGFYVTPVLYEPTQVPESFRWLNTINPMARIIQAERAVLIDHSWPGATDSLLIVATSLAAFGIGLAVFRRFGSGLIDEL